MQTRLVTSTAVAQSLYDLLGLENARVKGIQLDQATGTTTIGDRGSPVTPITDKVLPVRNTKNIYLIGVGTVNVALFN